MPAKKILEPETVKSYIDRVGPSLGYDFTYEPSFPEGREDVCAISRLAENGSTYGFDTVYLVWLDEEGVICHKEIANSRSSKDYIHIKSVTACKNKISVTISSGGSYSGKAWERTINECLGKED